MKVDVECIPIYPVYGVLGKAEKDVLAKLLLRGGIMAAWTYLELPLRRTKLKF